MNRSVASVICGIVTLAPSFVGAQQSIPLVDLPPATVKSPVTLGAVLGLRQTTDGKVLVNDALRRQLLLFDTTLATFSVAMDSVSGSSTSYGPRPTPLIPYRGDSSLFADWNSRTVIVLDGRGKYVHALALPRPQDMIALNAAASGFDAKGRLIFEGSRPSNRPGAATTPGLGVELGDSLPLFRADLDARRVDTIARIARPVMKVTSQKGPGGTITTVFTLDPLQASDEWAVLSNGSVAIVRGHDYHVDWIGADGATRSTPKLPFEWKRLSEDDKQKLSDSLRAAQDTLLASGYPAAESTIRTPLPCGAPDGRGSAGAGDGRGAGRSGGGGGGGGGGGEPPPGGGQCTEFTRSMLPPIGPPMLTRAPMPPLADLHRAAPIADYAPPMRINATMPDLDDNVWILPRVSTLSKRGELVYDVVNASGELVRRVRLPVGRAIVGFAKGGVVYLTSGDMKTGYTLERSRLPAAATASPKK